MSVLRSHYNKTRGGLGRVCATGTGTVQLNTWSFRKFKPGFEFLLNGKRPRSPGFVLRCSSQPCREIHQWSIFISRISAPLVIEREALSVETDDNKWKRSEPISVCTLYAVVWTLMTMRSSIIVNSSLYRSLQLAGLTYRSLSSNSSMEQWCNLYFRPSSRRLIFGDCSQINLLSWFVHNISSFWFALAS